MHIDISRSRFDATKAYSGVLALQGRVTLDSDQNELQDISRHQLRTALTDLIGQAGAPRDRAGFAIETRAASRERPADLGISAGRMYVDGICVENAAATAYWSQPSGHLDDDVDALPENGGYVAYLRVHERAVTVEQDPDLREVALGVHARDTTARIRVVWQVAALPVDADEPEAAMQQWRDALSGHLLAGRGVARARARIPDDVDQDVCSLSAEAMFRGHENQLYRVEILRGGPARQPEAAARRRRAAPRDQQAPAQLVWSRDNGSDVYAVSRLAGAAVSVADLGPDRRSALEPGDVVELVDDGLLDRMGRDTGAPVTRPLYTVTDVDVLRRTVLLDRDPAGESGEVGRDPDLHPLLRRWDGGPVEVVEGEWLALEDGVEVEFGAASEDQQPYRTGDHWLIPARRTTGDVIWPQDDAGPRFVAADGVAYHYAPLAFVPPGGGAATDLRRIFDPLTG